MLDDALEHLVRGIVSHPDEVRVRDKQLRQGRMKLPPGYQLAHYRTHEAARGCSYLCSHLNLRTLHRMQHRYDRNGKAIRKLKKILR